MLTATAQRGLSWIDFKKNFSFAQKETKLRKSVFKLLNGTDGEKSEKEAGTLYRRFLTNTGFPIMQILSRDILNGSFAKYYSHISGLDAAVTHSRYLNY